MRAAVAADATRKPKMRKRRRPLPKPVQLPSGRVLLRRKAVRPYSVPSLMP